MSKEKTLEPVQSVDEIKETEVPLQADEELVDETGDESEEPVAKPFKTREERAEFFKKKQQESVRKGDVLTKSDLFKINERKAIRSVTTSSDTDPAELKALKAEINDNWEAIVTHFNPSTDRSDVDAIVEAVIDAHTVWKRRTGGPKQDVDTEARSALMADGGSRGSTGKGVPAEKKSVLGKQSKGMDDWYSAKSN